MTAALRPCIFFDRDGVANAVPPPADRYVLAPAGLHVLPAFIEALRVVRARGYPAVIVTNQKCVFRGLVTPAQLEAIHAKLRRAVADAGLELLDIYSAVGGDADPEAKPRPGLLLRAAREHGLDLARSWMIGDQGRDIEAGRAAGCGITVFVAPGPVPPGVTHHAPGMDALPALLDAHLPNVTESHQKGAFAS